MPQHEHGWKEEISSPHTQCCLPYCVIALFQQRHLFKASLKPEVLGTLVQSIITSSGAFPLCCMYEVVAFVCISKHSTSALFKKSRSHYSMHNFTIMTHTLTVFVFFNFYFLKEDKRAKCSNSLVTLVSKFQMKPDIHITRPSQFTEASGRELCAVKLFSGRAQRYIQSQGERILIMLFGQ